MKRITRFAVLLTILCFGCKSAQQSVTVTLEAHFQKVDGLEKPPIMKVEYKIADTSANTKK